MKAKHRKATQRTSLGPLAQSAMDEYERAYELLKWSGNEEQPPSSLKKSLSYVWDGDDETLAKHIKDAIGQLYEKYNNYEFWEFGPDLMRLEEIDKAKAAVSEARRKAGKLGAKASRRTKLADPQVAAIMREVRRKLNDNANKLSANAIIRQVSRSHKGDNGLPIMSEAAVKKRLQRGRKEKRGKYKRETRPKK